MANEPLETEQVEEPEFERKPSANKDVWLFLIIIDIIFLCIFGFYLYKNLSAKFAVGSETRPAAMAEEAVSLPEIETSETTVTVAQIAAQQPVDAPVTAPESASSVFPVPAPLEESVQPAAPEVKKPEAQTPEKPQPAAKPQPKKDNVWINPKSKGAYKRVTFRYFGEGKDVDIVSGFTMSKPQSLKKVDGHWETTLSIAPGTYRYLYVVDGRQTLDPYAETAKGRSVVVIK